MGRTVGVRARRGRRRVHRRRIFLLILYAMQRLGLLHGRNGACAWGTSQNRLSATRGRVGARVDGWTMCTDPCVHSALLRSPALLSGMVIPPTRDATSRFRRHPGDAIRDVVRVDTPGEPRGHALGAWNAQACPTRVPTLPSG
jgi:hypothetical protein